jgi:hypothetical protein
MGEGLLTGVVLAAGLAYWVGYQQGLALGRKLERFGVSQAAWHADRDPAGGLLGEFRSAPPLEVRRG